MRHKAINSKLFVENRNRLRQLMAPNSLAIVNANDIYPTNADGSLRLIPQTDFFYLTGVEQEESILLLYPDADDEKHREILFLRETNENIAIWEGHKLTKEEAQQASGIKTVLWLAEFPRLLHRLMCECEHVFLNSNEHKRADSPVETREARFVAGLLRQYPLHDYKRLARLMHTLRVVKSDAEVELIQHACAITKAGFERVARFVKPGVNEIEIEAEFAHEFIRRRAGFAYTPIIASGPNACVLHYIDNDRPCRSGDMLLLDVASAYANYNSDLTRTIPVNGRFTKRQREVYEAVLRVLRGSIQGLVPGKKSKDWQKEAEQLIERECVNLGLITTREIKRQSPEKPAFKKYFMHGVGHPIGLDVHDVGHTTEPFAVGWVMTVEPAIYIREEGLAVRLENDILITENGPVDLMEDIPIEPEAIESLMAST
jgi:Xaa-Pro aminopeptidase